MKLAGQAVVVTGGGSGTGAALCRAFRAAGAAHIVVANIDAQVAQAVAAEAGGTAFACDFSDEGRVIALVDAAEQVTLLLGNGWEFLAIVFACARLGAIVVPIGTRQRRAELVFLLKDCGAQALIFDATHADAAPTPAALPTPPLLFVARGTADGAAAFDPLADTAPAAGSVPVAAEDSDVILYTSGTTGRKARG